MVDLNTYQPPGVYVDEDEASLVTVSGASPTVIALVGPSLGYRSATEIVTLAGTTPVVLSHLGASSGSVLVSNAQGVYYDLTTDYTVTIVDSGLPAEQQQVRVARTSSGGIPDGQQVYVSYNYTDATYYQPTRVTNLDDVQSLYGPAIDLSTNTVTSPVSLAAKFAFDNGAGTLVIVPTKGTTNPVTTQALKDAYSTLDSFEDVNIIVPLPVGISGTDGSMGSTATVGSDLEDYISAQEALSILRIGIVGMDTSAVVDPAALVVSYRSRRIMHAHPNRLLFYNAVLNATLEIGGFYLAAAYAGRFASQTPAVPLTKKQIKGFNGLPPTMSSQMTTAKKNTWSDSGVAVAEITKEGTLVVRHGTSTDRTNTLTREISLVRARDAMVSLIQTTLDSSGLIGSYIEGDTVTAIGGVIEGILETAMTLEYIVGYQSVQVRQRAGLPSIIDVRFQYKPAYPLNYITVTFSVDTTSGDTTVTA